VTCEPTNGEIGKLIRKTLKEDIFSLENTHQFDRQMALLFAADRHYHIFNKVDGILTNLAKNVDVVSTRYYFSSIAYNANTTEDFNWIQELNSNFPQPDLLIYINLPVEISLVRLAKRKFLEIYEEKEKLLRVTANYNKILENYTGKVLKVDGKESIEKVHLHVVEYLEKNDLV
jgi:dTMP kinase